MSKLILIRHGQSEWNKKNIFTGWVDIPLSVEGVEEAFRGGQQISHLPIDIIYTSTLIRGIMTAMLVMNVHSSGKTPVILHEDGDFVEWFQAPKDDLVPVKCAWQLNERMYGDLQGQNKQQVKEKFGEAQFKLWRRSYDVPPPNGESLEMTAKRTLPYFDMEIIPQLQAGKNVLVSAHGNSLRSIVMELDGLSEEEVVALEIPTGVPIIYDFENGKWRKQK